MANHMFSGASNVTISGGNFVVDSCSNLTLRDLSSVAALSALHDAPARTDQSRCHPHTRTNVLDHVERWAQGLCDEGAPIFWLHGGAGAGKSAIMQTLAERFTAHGIALGCVFFSRSDSSRNTALVLIPTLIYQLARTFPPVLPFLDAAINSDPGIFMKSFEVQLRDLFIPALRHLVQLGAISDAPLSPRVFLVDGLDECSDPRYQQHIIQAFAATYHEHQVPVKFLVASRPEFAISASFKWYTDENHVMAAISLSDDPDAEDDIRRFIDSEFDKIRSMHPFKHMLTPEWPALYDINRLVWKSSFHFIYASTVMKYIWATQENPVRSLKVVLGIEASRISSPFVELDALYHHILEHATHRDEVIRILSCCLFVPLLTHFVNVICLLHGYSRRDFQIFMADMDPLVTIAIDRKSGHKSYSVALLHASLGDYLRNKGRSGPLYADEAVYLTSILKPCFELFPLRSYFRPNWPEEPSDPYSPKKQQQLTVVISGIIQKFGYIPAIRDVLESYDLRYFIEELELLPGRFQHDVIRFVKALHSVKKFDSGRLFQRQLQFFFENLPQFFISLRDGVDFPGACHDLSSIFRIQHLPLGPAILPLAFMGYPAQSFNLMLYHYADQLDSNLHSDYYGFMDLGSNFLNLATAEDLASTDSHTMHTSTTSLAIAAETIVMCLHGGAMSNFSSIRRAHRSWLQRTKPGKNISTGSPRLASINYKQFYSTLRPSRTWGYRDISRKPLSAKRRAICKVIGPQNLKLLASLKLNALLLDALLWILPKAGFSERLLHHSKRVLPCVMFQHRPRLAHRVRKCLDEYHYRLQITMLEKLDRRVEAGDLSALIEKLSTLELNLMD